MNIVSEIVRGKLYPPKDTHPDFSGRNVIVTGANTGLGFEAALKFVQLGAAKVILACRSQEKGNVARERIETQTGQKGVAEVWPLDMLDYDSLKAFAQRAETLDHLDIVILNAGVSTDNFEQSRHGWERTLQVNVLSTAALGVLLLPKLQKSRTKGSIPVLEIVNSSAHTFTKAADEVVNGSTDPLEYYNDPKHFEGSTQYGISKLLLMFIFQQMASTVVKDDGTYEAYLVAVCPGPSKSEITREKTGFVMDIVKAVIFSAFRTAEQGSRTYISGVTLGQQGHGRFWQNDTIQPISPSLINETGKRLQKRLCSSVVEALKVDIPQVSALVDRTL